ncbi:hypothetical protein [Paenibacillus sp. PDC88]|uniref:CobQ/CobB/MinD/ParA nucleotide binding domain-containing protein n=2 Tax=Bacillati TaxID=1783272 RepID=A0ABW3PZQ0_9BACL|nr:hypothetical protein [Paenibacillus sp. PDC88]SDX62456.1 CobQ/CobB/MinD/ParA nucleotide binding domain-containing protein [Paenibacillus sp. PDC88]
MNRIFLATPDRDEAEWFADELSDIGRIVRTIDSLDFFVPQWESIESNIVVFMENVIRSDDAFKRLVAKIRIERPGSTIMLIYHREDDELISSLMDEGITCLNYMDLEPGIVEVRILEALGHSVRVPVLKNPQENCFGEKLDEGKEEYQEETFTTEVEIISDETTEKEDGSLENTSLDNQPVSRFSESAREFSRQISETSAKLFEKIDEKKKAIIEGKKQKNLDVIRTEELDFAPVLQKNAKRKKERFVGTAVIAVTGVKSGVGCTHTAIMLANYLASENYPVLLIEANDSNDFVEIEAAYEGIDNPTILKNPTFTIDGVRYAKSVKDLKLYHYHSGNYAFIIIDMGAYQESYCYEEFLRANISIVVGSGSEWKQKDIMNFFEEQIDLDQSRWKLCVPMASKQTVDDIRKKLPKRKIHSLPFQTDPYQKDKVVNSTLEEILKLHQHQRLSLLKKKMQTFFQD